jgi:rubrerythrin
MRRKMKQNPDKMVEALDFAIRFEREGKEFFEEAAKITNNSLGKDVFRTLAEEENVHMNKIMEVYQDLEKKGKWEERITVVGNPDRLKTVFAGAMEKIDKDIKVSTSDLEALKKAMELEQRGQKLYNGLAEKAADPLEKRFHLTLATEERGHFLLILDSYDYLSDPSGWFAQKERSLLDGG